MEFDSFNQILIWPLQILGATSSKAGDFLAECDRHMEAEGSPWRPADLYERIPDPQEEDTRYSEFVYFHPFVQRFLYSRSDAPNNEDAALRLLQREDIKGVRIALGLWDPQQQKSIRNEVTLAVTRMHLYFFRTRVAFLVVEVETISGQRLKRELVLEIQDRLRRAYTPFWIDDQPGLCPVEVEWLGDNGRVIARSDYNDKSSYETIARNYRAPPLSKHWSELLRPLEYCLGRPKNGVLSFRQIEDERIPAMTFVTVENPADQISDGDWIRLAFLDGDGNQHGKPYSASFLRDFEKTYCYDRFWDPGAGMLTRYLCCGYGFTVVADTRDRLKAILHKHFRHHYFQMGLITHFHRASLLVFSDRLSRERTGTKIQLLQSEIVDFVGQFWFKEISNQLQGRELFELWSRHLNTAVLFQQVMRE